MNVTIPSEVYPSITPVHDVPRCSSGIPAIYLSPSLFSIAIIRAPPGLRKEQAFFNRRVSAYSPPKRRAYSNTPISVTISKDPILGDRS